ncbi:MAG: hypothetical protein MJ188_07135 [Treponema sp.]|nr:hypothetical protein [Treponema sp.]
MKKYSIIALMLTVLLSYGFSKSKKNEKSEDWNTNYTYVFVHGLSGWGHYDAQNKFMPYWGMQNGSLMKQLKKMGFDVHDASVAPQGSAWDRACELYAQLTGSVTDYGIEHSSRCNHPRFGKDFSKDPLIKNWSSEEKINLLGHSFGGVTIRLLAHLMANGAESEIAVTPKNELSPLFAGGHDDWIYSVTTLAAPHNGTSAYHIKDPEPAKKTKMQQAMDKINNKVQDDRASFDVAAYDMHIDNAAEINKWLKTLQKAYYFSYSTNATILQADGTYLPNPNIMETLYRRTSELMGSFEGTTFDGLELSKEWRMNDGLVNTISARAPSSAPTTVFNKNEIVPGVWNIMPTYEGDHMALQGGFKIKNDVRDFYVTHLEMINRL